MTDDPTTHHVVEPEDRSEVLDSETLGTPDDVLIDPNYPYDELFVTDDYGTTAAEEHVGEPLEERVEREQPDPLRDELERSAATGTATAPLDASEVSIDVSDAAIDTSDVGDRVGRLMEPGVGDDISGVDDEGDAIAHAFDDDDLSAEEAAVRVTEDPPMGTLGGDYL